jgi:hypothetical protein
MTLIGMGRTAKPVLGLSQNRIKIPPIRGIISPITDGFSLIYQMNHRKCSTVNKIYKYLQYCHKVDAFPWYSQK